MTDADKLRNYLEPLSLQELRDFCKESGIDVIPSVAYESHLPDYKRDVLKAAFAFQEPEPVRWTRAMRAAGIRMYDPKLYPQVEPEYLKHRCDFIENWEVYPPVKHEGKQVQPWRSKMLGVHGVWKLANKPMCRDVTRPFEFEEFLQRDPHFQTSEHRAGNGSVMYELSHVGMRKRRWIDGGKRLRKSLWAAWHTSGRVWKRIVEATKHPVIATVLGAVILAIVANFVLKRFGFRLLP